MPQGISQHSAQTQRLGRTLPGHWEESLSRQLQWGSSRLTVIAEQKLFRRLDVYANAVNTGSSISYIYAHIFMVSDFSALRFIYLMVGPPGNSSMYPVGYCKRTVK